MEPCRGDRLRPRHLYLSPVVTSSSVKAIEQRRRMLSPRTACPGPHRVETSQRTLPQCDRAVYGNAKCVCVCVCVCAHLQALHRSHVVHKGQTYRPPASACMVNSVTLAQPRRPIQLGVSAFHGETRSSPFPSSNLESTSTEIRYRGR